MIESMSQTKRLRATLAARSTGELKNMRDRLVADGNPERADFVALIEQIIAERTHDHHRT